MIDSSFSSSGAKVVLASSSDESHPPENIVDGNMSTFWMSTGMFPQEFIIRFNEPTTVSAVTVDSYNEFEYTEGHLQTNAISLNPSSAIHLRFIITSGYDHFVSVHKVSIKN
ncbi:intraflagellar transport protein 25 homolog isoform X2 [Oryzias melastigma]|uniref:intraflagellar transport protein 25 homolog isoform X2 n=1 Tax=Oryzias melastigma TaxID=30732 RepID=UPI000CF7F938|nr:intraflagellar transport protein 25 homolog isoform X2 [Oryzias melastigma]